MFCFLRGVETLEESKEEDATTLNAIFEMYLLGVLLDVVCVCVCVCLFMKTTLLRNASPNENQREIKGVCGQIFVFS